MELPLMFFLCVAISSFPAKGVARKDPLVYFKATLPKSSNSVAAHHFGVGRIIPFNSVDANIGRGYNPSSGVFVVPVSGYYQFRALVQTIKGASDFALIAKGSVKAYVTVPTGWTSTTLSVITHVNRGDHVFIRKTYQNGDSPLRQGQWTQFTGYLLRKD